MQSDDSLGLDSVWMDIIALHDGSTLQTHGPSRCAGSFCAIHRPSPHPLNEAPLRWVAEINLLLRVCEHDSVHPDPDSMEYLRRRLTLYDGWHRCCSEQCCMSPQEKETI